MGKRKNIFSNFDFNPSDVPKAIIIHELLGIAMLALTWTACYYIQFSKIPVIQNKLNQVASMIPQQISSSFAKIPYLGTEEILKSRIGSAYLESSCLRKLIRPFTLPAKLVLTYKIVKAFSTPEEEVLSLPIDSEVKPVSCIWPKVPTRGAIKSLFQSNRLKSSPNFISQSFI